MSSEWPGTKSCKHCRDIAWNSRKHYTQLSAQKIFGLSETWEPPFFLIWIPQYRRSLIASPGVKTFGSWGLALLVPSLCHLSPSAAALGNQTVSGCAASCFEGGRHPSFHGVCDPFDGRLFLAGSFALKKFTQLKWGGSRGGLWIWDSQGKQNISSPSSWHLPKARLSLVPHSRVWSLSSVLLWEDVQSGRCGRRVCLLKWQLGLTWKENSKLPDCFPCHCSSCLTCRHWCNVKCVQMSCIHPFLSLLLVISFSFMFHVSPSDLKPSDINRRSWVEASRAWWGWRCLLMDRKGSFLPDECLL